MSSPSTVETLVASQRYKRRRDGCQTCRSRRVKCGGEKPKCGHCQRLVLQCRWPEIVDATSEGSRTKRRRNITSVSPVYTRGSEHSAEGCNQPIEPLEILSQLASQPSFDTTSWHPYQQSVLPDQLHTQSALSRLIPSEAHTTVDPRDTHFSSGVSIFNPNRADEDCTLGGSEAVDLALDNSCSSAFDDNFSFDLLFGLDQPVLLSSTSATDDRRESGIFEVPNFDSWAEEQEHGQHGSAQSRLCSPVTLEPNDQPITTYFLSTVARAAITRYHNTPNYYVSLFSCSLFCPALYHGVLAWSALHMAVGMDPSEPRRKELCEYATKKHTLCANCLFPNLENVDFDNQGEVEALYCALMVFGQYKAVSCAAANDVRRVVDAIDGLHQRRGFVGSTSPLVQRMVSILAQYDVRSTFFGVDEPSFTLRLGSKVFEPEFSSSTGTLGTVSVLHLHYIDAKSSDIERQLRDARSSQDIHAIRRVTRLAEELYDRVVRLEYLFDPEKLKDFGQFDWSRSVDTLAQAGTKPALSQDIRHEILLAAHFHAVVLNVSRILNYPMSTRSIDRVIGLTLDLSIRHLEGVHGVLAIPVFLAAVECESEVKFESALKWFALPHAAVFGTLAKSRELLLEVRQAQSEGARVDIGKIMMRPKYNFLM